MYLGKTLRVLERECDVEVYDAAQFEKLYMAAKLQSKLYDAGEGELNDRDLESVVNAMHIYYAQQRDSSVVFTSLDSIIDACYQDFMNIHACEVSALVKDITARII